MGLLDIDLRVRYQRDDEAHTLKLSLVEDPGNEIKDFANYFQILPTSLPDYDILLMSAYIETGWWFVPSWLEKRIQHRSVMDIMRGIQTMATQCREEMNTLEPEQWLAGSPDKSRPCGK